MSASALCVQRLQKELRRIAKDPIPFVETLPDPANILEWHFVVHGVPKSVYTGGFYHGLLRFPAEYPLRPPGILMFTPSGRFETSARLCLSISDFHPEEWNPLWSVQSILTGFLSFMQEEARAVGSIRRSDAERRALAARSLAFNVKNAKFRELFPHLVKLYDQRSRIRDLASAETSEAARPTEEEEAEEEGHQQQPRPPASKVLIAVFLFASAAIFLWSLLCS